MVQGTDGIVLGQADLIFTDPELAGHQALKCESKTITKPISLQDLYVFVVSVETGAPGES